MERNEPLKKTGAQKSGTNAGTSRVVALSTKLDARVRSWKRFAPCKHCQEFNTWFHKSSFALKNRADGKKITGIYQKRIFCKELTFLQRSV
jgi:hypothetical protein